MARSKASCRATASRRRTAVQVREPITEVAAPMRAPGEPACRKVVNHSASRTPGLMAEPRGKLTAPVPTNGERALALAGAHGFSGGVFV